MQHRLTWPMRVAGVLMALVGLVWIGQGVNVIPGSFMTGRMEWAYRGGGLLAVGLIILYLSPRRR